MTDSQATTVTAPPRRMSPWIKWFLIPTIIVAVLLGVLVALIPTIISSGLVVSKVRAAVREASADLADFDKLSFSWDEGVTLEGVHVKNPAGFPKGDAVRIGHSVAKFSFRELLFSSQVHVRLRVKDPVVRIYRGKDGKVNLERISELTRGNVDVKVHEKDKRKIRRAAKASRKAMEEEGLFENLKLDLGIEGGRIEVLDESLAVKSSIRDLTLRIGNQAVGDPITVNLEGRIVDATHPEGGRFTAHVDTHAKSGLPTLINFQTHGKMDISRYGSLAAPFLEEGFESLSGKLDGGIRIALDWDRDEISVGGDLKIDDLELIGGPLGKGRGIKSKAWRMRPDIKLQKGATALSLSGTELELGFARITGLSGTDAAALERPEWKASNPTLVPLGIRLEVDLAKLAEQPGLLPEGKWSGKLVQDIAAFLDPAFGPGEQRSLPYATKGKLTGLGVPQELLPEGARVPTGFEHRSHGIASPKEAIVRALEYVLTAEGVAAKLTMKEGSATKLDSDYRVDLVPEAAKGWLDSFLPKGMTLTGKSVVTGKASGSGDLAKTVTLAGNFSASAALYLGNSLRDFSQEYSWSQQKGLNTRTLQPAKLNNGPLSLSINIARKGKQDGLALKLNWNGGQAKYGVTPVLQYAFPLLAGLHASDMQAVTKIDFSAIMGLNLELSGPLPGPGQSFEDVYKAWSGKGALKLADGAFTPSQALSKILALAAPGQNRIRFSSVDGGLELKDGKVQIRGLELGGKSGRVRISGSTSLIGVLEHEIDFTDLLRQHKDGKRILAALGNKPVVGKLRGGLSAPRLEVADFAKQALENGLQNAVQGILGGLGGGKKPGDVLKDLLKGLKGK